METNRILTDASKSNPCPHCGKPDWCYFIGELTVCKRDQPPATSWEATSKIDAEGTPYYAPVQEKKAIRPAKTSYFSYPARNGSPLVRVKRIDYGDGQKKDFYQERWENGKWVPGLASIKYGDIPIYCYGEIQEAIFRNELIFITEGETCADALWDLGLAATCNIGGSAKEWLRSDDLKGAKIVICPDRDQPGVAFAAKIAEHFPSAMWLYAYPESKAWDNLPKSQGLDIKDWIETYNLSREDILAAVGERRQGVKNEEGRGIESKVISHPKFEAPSLEGLKTEIDLLLNADLKRSDLHLRFAELARQYRLSNSEISKAYYLKAEEAEREADRPDVAAEIEALLNAHKSSIALTEVLPVGLAEPIDKLAKMLALRSECYLAALLTQVSSLFKVGTETMLRRDTDWRCVPNYFTGIVGESSVAKSPILKAMIDRPMRLLREKASKEFEQAQANYETELNSWKAAKKEEDRGPAPKEPRLRIYSFDKTTGEGIIYQQAEYPDQAMMYSCDELAGVFKSGNQYRGGKGSDEEDMLSFWNGTGTTVLRAAGVRASLEAVGLSIFGTIQPDVLAYLLKDCSDSNGKFARFDFVFQPLTASELPLDDSGKFSITPMLADLYTKIDALPATFFELDQDAKHYFATFRNACNRRQLAEPKQGLRAAIGKMPEKVGKLATTIYALTCIFNGQQVTNHIPRSAVEAAVKFVKFAADQVASLYTEFSDRTALAPNLAKIVLLAERKGGKISVRDAQLCFNTKVRPAATLAREWFNELAVMGYGTIRSTGKSFQFELSTSTTSTMSSKLQPVNISSSTINFSTSTTSTTSVDFVDVGLQIGLQTKPLQQVEFSQVSTTDLHFAASENFTTDDTDENVSDSIEFIRVAIAANCIQTVKDIQAVLAEQSPKDKQAIWGHLTAEEKANFRLLLAKSEKIGSGTTQEPQPLDTEEIEPVDEDRSDVLTCTQLPPHYTELEQELLATTDLQEFSDFADWLSDSQQLENLCHKLGGQPLIFWIAQQIQEILSMADKSEAVGVIANLRQQFSKEDLQAAGKLVAGDKIAIAKLRELVEASKNSRI